MSSTITVGTRVEIVASGVEGVVTAVSPVGMYRVDCRGFSSHFTIVALRRV